ncbi:MAG: DUF6125 family protein [Promethearchaeota archaeon]
MKKVTDADKLFYYERNFFTLDGIWMIETEKKIGWDKALYIDTIVWIRLLKIIIRRIKKYLNIKTNSLKNLAEILTFRWSIEGWEYERGESEKKNQILFIVKKCPYKATMDRNEQRHDKIPFICKNMCTPMYKAVVEDFNPKIKLVRKKSMGLGDEYCDFNLIVEE